MYSHAQSWQAVSTNRPTPAAHFMGMDQSLGIQLVQLLILELSLGGCPSIKKRTCQELWCLQRREEPGDNAVRPDSIHIHVV